MKKHLVKGIVVLLSLAFLALPAMSAVSLAPNDKGDLLIYPMYYAMEGIETNITVINTSPTCCAVAKVIVRSHKYSIEVLDFLIYLTPNDVFKAVLKYEGGKYVLVSTDDSLLLGKDAIVAQASVANPIALELYAPTYACTCATDDSPDWGYIDVIEVTSYPRLTGCDPATECCVQADGTILKADLFAHYRDDAGAMHPDNILTGDAALVFPGAEYALFKPTVLKDYNNSTKLIVGDPDPRFSPADNAAIEAALSKNNLVVPYFNKSDAFTVAWLTFPTKQTKCAGDSDCSDWGTDSCYFNHIDNDAELIPTYGVSLYDLEEHERHVEGCVRSPCVTPPRELPEEVNLIFDWLSGDNPYSEGWARVVLENTLDHGDPVCGSECIYYSDAPVIGLIAEITPEGLSLMAPAYDFGTIYHDATSVDCGDGDCDGECESGCYQLGCLPCGEGE